MVASRRQGREQSRGKKGQQPGRVLAALHRVVEEALLRKERTEERHEEPRTLERRNHRGGRGNYKARAGGEGAWLGGRRGGQSQADRAPSLEDAPALSR